MLHVFIVFWCIHGPAMLMMLLPVVAKPLVLGSIEAMERVLCLDVDDFGREGYARKPATTKFLAPCEICFTQATIKSEFKNGKSLEETACQLACSDIQKRDLPMIQVVQHSDGFMYSLDNRRLAVFRLLQLTGIIRGIKVLIIPMDERQWRKKFTRKAITCRSVYEEST